MAVLKLFREPGGNKAYRPWYHLSLKEHDYEQLFCAKMWEQLFPDVRLEPGESRQVEVTIKIIELV